MWGHRGRPAAGDYIHRLDYVEDHWEPRATPCPDCGADLDAGPSTVDWICRACGSWWAVDNREWRKLAAPGYVPDLFRDNSPSLFNFDDVERHKPGHGPYYG